MRGFALGSVFIRSDERKKDQAQQCHSRPPSFPNPATKVNSLVLASGKISVKAKSFSCFQDLRIRRGAVLRLRVDDTL